MADPLLRAILWLAIGDTMAVVIAALITDSGQIAVFLAILLAGWTLFVGCALRGGPQQAFTFTPGILVLVPLSLLVLCLMLATLVR